MNILHYTQHVLGIGHLFRSLAIDRALAPATVHLVTGGPAVTLEMPANVRHHPMPALKMDSDFREVLTVDRNADLESTWGMREAILLDLLRRIEPEVILVEMFPFGRKRFSRELLPLLDVNSAREKPARVLCSLRDILVEKDDQAAFEAKALKWLNRYFDGVLVHADPELISLEATFSRVADIACPLWYTGYVAQGPQESDRTAARAALGLDGASPIVLASAGSGTVGGDLLLATVMASRLLAKSLPHRLLLFHGPHADVEVRRQLAGLAADQPHMRIEAFASRFPDYLLASDLSVSMAGYNTTMNLLACGTPGLLYPFDQNREQRLRLTALADRGCLELLEAADLEPAHLARRIERALSAPATEGPALRLHGDRESAAIIHGLLAGEDQR